MSLDQLLNVAKKSAKGLFLAGIFIGALSFFLLVVTQKNSRATTDLLVVQNNIEGMADYFAQSKSVDYLNGILIESVYSEKFLAEMKNTNEMSVAYLPVNKVNRLKTWQRTVSLKKNANAGIISIDVFGDSPQQVTEISNAMIDVLTKQYSEFLGQGQNIEIKVLSGPIADKNPTTTQVVLVSFGGFAIGFLLAFLWAVYREEKRTREGQLPDIGEYATIDNQEKSENRLAVEQASVEDNFPQYSQFAEDSQYWQERLKMNL